jgi:phosphate-selective porin
MKRITKTLSAILFAVFLAVICYPVVAQQTQQQPSDTVQKEPSKVKEFALTLSQKLKLSGYAQARYQYFFEEVKNTTDKKPNTFDIRRARLDLRGNIHNDKLGFRLQVDLAGIPKLLDAVLSYSFNKYLKASIGQFHVPFSLENNTSSRLLFSINRSQVVESLVARGGDVNGNQNGRDLGFQLSGVINAGDKEFNILEYAIGVFNGEGINTLDQNAAKEFSGRVVVQPVKGFSFGGSYYNGEGNYFAPSDSLTANRNRDRFGGEIAFVKPRYAASAEFIRGEDDETSKQGFYVQASGYPVKDKLQIVYKYDWFDPNIDADDNASTHHIFGINYYLNKYARMQAHYQLSREEADAQVDNDIIVVMLQLGF